MKYQIHFTGGRRTAKSDVRREDALMRYVMSICKINENYGVKGCEL